MTAFDYGNARLRAMKSRLLTAGELESLAGSRGVPGMAAALAATAYRPAVDAAMARGGSGPNLISRALLLDLKSTVARIASYYRDEAGHALGIILRRYDVHNLKAVLRGVSRGAAPEAIADAWMPPGEIPETVLRELARTGDLRAALDRMATLRMPAARPLMEVRGANPGAGLFELELALSRWHHLAARADLQTARAAGQILAADLARLSDLDDLLAVLRRANTPARDRPPLGDIAESLLGEGRLSMRQLTTAAERETIETAITVLERTPYGPALQSGLRRFRVSGRLSDFEAELRRDYLHHAAGLVRTDPLGAGVPLGYLALKSNEIANLRWIARGVSAELPAAEIRAGLL